MRTEAAEVYRKLIEDYKIVGEKGSIDFTLKGLSVAVHTKDSIGNLLQEWLKTWLRNNNIDFIENTNSQLFPDFLLNSEDLKKGLLEVKTFDYERGPGFDLANFDSYCNSLLTSAYRLDSDYLIFGYKMSEGEITIENVWLKKIWELSCPSGTYPIKVQEKRNVIYNLRPGTWYSARRRFDPFPSKESFLTALNQTRYEYPQTRPVNGHWLRNVLKNYKEHTGVLLEVE